MKETQEEKKMSETPKYKLFPMSEITDESRMIAVSWIENYGTMGFDIENKHKLASDIMNYASNQLTTLTIELDKANKQIEIFEKEYEVALNQIIMQEKELEKAKELLEEYLENGHVFGRTDLLIKEKVSMFLKINSLNKKENESQPA